MKSGFWSPRKPHDHEYTPKDDRKVPKDSYRFLDWRILRVKYGKKRQPPQGSHCSSNHKESSRQANEIIVSHSTLPKPAE
jgi:hypothetical protein